jgi:probable F420-dependent oxidoreductase
MKFGVFLPTFLFPGTGPEQAVRLREFARKAEELGFDSLWITDHIVTAHGLYGVSWLDSLTTLSHVSAITERVRLGTSVLILPVRQPVVLAKEIATLQHLSGGRYDFGIGTGWYGPEFEAAGVHKSERGVRTDEVLDAVNLLLREPNANFSGRYYALDDVTVEPLSTVPPVWVAGGRQLVHAASPEKSMMHPRVLERIARSDAWIARPTCPPDLIAVDMAEIQAARTGAGLDGQPFTMAHENFVYIVEEGSPEQVVQEQQEKYFRLTGSARPWDYIEAVYLNGTIDRIQAMVEARRQVGIEYMMLHTLTDDISQLELIARHIVQPFANA